jgi:hypothetical protein
LIPNIVALTRSSREGKPSAAGSFHAVNHKKNVLSGEPSR